MGALARISSWVTSVPTLSRPRPAAPAGFSGPQAAPYEGWASSNHRSPPQGRTLPGCTRLPAPSFPARINDREKTELQNLAFVSHSCLLTCLWPRQSSSKQVPPRPRPRHSVLPASHPPSRGPAPRSASWEASDPSGPPRTPRLPEPTLLFPLSTFPSHAGPIRVHKTALGRKRGGEHSMSFFMGLAQNDR